MKKLNIAELLRDCPTGMELDCTMFDNVTLVGVNIEQGFPIEIKVGCNTKYLTKEGCYHRLDCIPSAKCVIFPKGKTTWEGFQRPFKDGDIVFYNDTISIFKEWGDETLFRAYACTYLCIDVLDTDVPLFGKSIKKEIRLATEEEKQKLFDTIKANGYKWNPETKTLEKLIKPKFKVGDRITNGKVSITIGYIDYNYYYEVGRNIANRLFIKNQDDWELVPSKFNISTLKPFDKVLVRCNSLENWHIQFFEKYNTELGAKYPFICLCNSKYCQCIPYESNEHLLNTTNDCDEYFKTWE